MRVLKQGEKVSQNEKVIEFSGYELIRIRWALKADMDARNDKADSYKDGPDSVVAEMIREPNLISQNIIYIIDDVLGMKDGIIL